MIWWRGIWRWIYPNLLQKLFCIRWNGASFNYLWIFQVFFPRCWFGFVDISISVGKNLIELRRYWKISIQC